MIAKAVRVFPARLVSLKQALETKLVFRAILVMMLFRTKSDIVLVKPAVKLLHIRYLPPTTPAVNVTQGTMSPCQVVLMILQIVRSISPAQPAKPANLKQVVVTPHAHRVKVMVYIRTRSGRVLANSVEIYYKTLLRLLTNRNVSVTLATAS